MRRLKQAQNAHLQLVNCAFSPVFALPNLRSLRFHTACNAGSLASTAQIICFAKTVDLRMRIVIITSVDREISR
jgi:hypothetical protein